MDMLRTISVGALLPIIGAFAADLGKKVEIWLEVGDELVLFSNQAAKLGYGLVATGRTRSLGDRLLAEFNMNPVRLALPPWRGGRTQILNPHEFICPFCYLRHDPGTVLISYDFFVGGDSARRLTLAKFYNIDCPSVKDGRLAIKGVVAAVIAGKGEVQAVSDRRFGFA